jgi:hypothetical protein
MEISDLKLIRGFLYAIGEILTTTWPDRSVSGDAIG